MMTGHPGRGTWPEVGTDDPRGVSPRGRRAGILPEPSRPDAGGDMGDRRAVLAAGAVAALVAGVVVAALAGTAGVGERAAAPPGDLTVRDLRRLPGPPVFWLGPVSGGVPVEAVTLRTHPAPRGTSVGVVTVHHGTGAPCAASGTDARCPPSLPQVQTWPACVRNPSSYSLGPGLGPLPRMRLTLRGVPAAVFEDGARVEVYTGRTTVVVFRDRSDRRRARDVVAALRGANPAGRDIGPGESLPPPVAGALEGRLRCTAAERRRAAPGGTARRAPREGRGG
jgi:hypothetical protein